MDLLGHFLRLTPHFKGRGRLTRFWIQRPRSGDQRVGKLPGSARIRCDMSVPYECMVWLGREEEMDLAALCRILRPGQTFVDCGANVGVWTLTAAMTLGTKGSVHAFEPNPATFEKLKRNVEMNALAGSVRAFCVACGESEDRRLLVCSEQHNNSMLVSSPREDALMVSVTTLDKALGSEPVQGIKIDVEGHEIHVLKGAQELLRRCKPWVCVEFNTLLAGSRRLGDWNVHQFLTALGYSCRRMMNAAISPAVEELRDDWEASGYCNLFYCVI